MGNSIRVTGLWEHNFKVKGVPTTIMEARLKEGMDAPLKECTKGSIIQIWPNPEYDTVADNKQPPYVLRVIPDGVKPGKEKRTQSSSTGNTPQ